MILSKYLIKISGGSGIATLEDAEDIVKQDSEDGSDDWNNNSSRSRN